MQRYFKIVISLTAFIWKSADVRKLKRHVRC